MFKKWFCPVILGAVIGFIGRANAQYARQWQSDGRYFIGCENTDGDAAKEVVFFSENSYDRHIFVIDGVTGALEWDSGAWDEIDGSYNYYTDNPRLIDVDSDGRYEILFYGKKVTGAKKWYLYGFSSGKEESPEKVYKPKVFQNYPNPLRSMTRIKYNLPNKGKVTLKLYNEAGQLVRTLVDGEKKPGEYTTLWDGRDDRGKKVASGSYFYKIETENHNSSKKMILVK